MDSIKKNGVVYKKISAVKNKIGYSETALKNLCASNSIECIKVGGGWYVSEKSLIAGAKILQRRAQRKELILTQRVKKVVKELRIKLGKKRILKIELSRE